MSIIIAAENFAREKHMGQKYGSYDYFDKHIQGVVESVSTSLSETAGIPATRINTVLTVAYLHDTVEDSDATVEEIESLFGVDIADAVDAMTHRDEESYQDYVKRALANDLARVVKYHDILFNLNQTLTDGDDSNRGRRRVDKYMKALQQSTPDFIFHKV